MWGAWNPTKVLPEILMPLGGYIAAYIIYPITGNYLGALIFSENFIFVLFILFLLIVFFKFEKNRLTRSNSLAILGELFFLVSFFLIFKHLNQSSYTGFWAKDLTCTFNYVLPGLLNGAVILYMECFDNFNEEIKKRSIYRKAFLIVALYFTLFSSTQLTILLASYSFIKCCSVLIIELKKKLPFHFTNYICKVWLFLVILVVWLVTLIFDINGGRKVVLKKGFSLLSDFDQALGYFIDLIKFQNKYVFLLFSLVLVFGAIFAFLSLKHDRQQTFTTSFITFCFCFIITTVYLLLVFSRSIPSYAKRPDAMWAFIFLYVLLVNMTIVFLVENVDFLKLFFPLFIIISSLIAFNFNCPPIYGANVNHEPQTVINLNKYIISQIVEADKNGKSSVDVKVPVDEKGQSPAVFNSNWPHPYNMGVWLDNTLYAHHLIRTRMQINFKPDKKINKQFYENRKHEQPFVPTE